MYDFDAVVIAAGEASRFASATPKHLVSIGGEILLDRTHRLLGLSGVDSVITIVPPGDQRYKNINLSITNLKERKGQLGMNCHKLLEASLVSNPKKDLLIIYGDVFFSREAMETIVSSGPKEKGIRAFCRFGGQKFFGRKYGEIFAFWIPRDKKTEFDNAISQVEKLFVDDVIWRAGGWEICKYLSGLSTQWRYKDHPRLKMYFEIDDLTDDIDFIRDFEILQSRIPDRHHDITDKLVSLYGELYEASKQKRLSRYFSRLRSLLRYKLVKK